MKLLKCKFCRGEVDIIGEDRSVNKKIKCTKCSFTNVEEKKEPEVFVIRRRTNQV